MLNREHFVLIAGNPGRWDINLRSRVENGEDLCAVQEDQHAHGRRSAELVCTSQGYVIRAGSSLMKLQIMFMPQGYGTFDQLKNTEMEYWRMGLVQCLEWGINWVNEDPDNRELYIRK